MSGLQVSAQELWPVLPVRRPKEINHREGISPLAAELRAPVPHSWLEGAELLRKRLETRRH